MLYPGGCRSLPLDASWRRVVSGEAGLRGDGRRGLQHNESQ
jgi:hypothetical protein